MEAPITQMSMGTPTRSPPQNLTLSTTATSMADEHIPDTPESLTDVLERIKARSEAAGHKVTIDLPPRPSSLALMDDHDDDSNGTNITSKGDADNDNNNNNNSSSRDEESYDVDSARKLLVQAQRRTDRILTDQQQRRMLMGGGRTTLDADERQQLQQARQSGGIISSAGNWLFGSKIERRRKEGLRVQVEEQRRVLRRAIRRQSSNSSGGGGGDGDGNHKHHHDHHRDHHRNTAATGGIFAGGICSAISAAYSYEQSDDDEASTSSGRCSRCSSATSASQEGEEDDEDVVEHPIDTGSGYHVNVHVPTPKAATAKAKEGQGGSGDGGGGGFNAAAAAAVDTIDANQNDNSNEDEYANVDDDEDLAMEVVVEAEDNITKHILNAAQMKSVALNVLPPSVRYCRWRRLYSLARDGDSFEAFLRHVAGWKRTLLVLSTSRGDVFGAYADSAWENQGHSLGATFYGSAQASLWRIESKNDNTGGSGSSGSKVVVYKWTGANRYIQLCDPQAKLLALGGGGDDGEFGLCVENDFQRGSTGSCETFGNEPLCSQDRFDIVDLECYGFPAGFA